MLKILLVALLLVLHSPLWAASLSIPLDDQGKFIPASDLVDMSGIRIDEVEATELKNSGFDISELDPFSHENIYA